MSEGTEKQLAVHLCVPGEKRSGQWRSTKWRVQGIFSRQNTWGVVTDYLGSREMGDIKSGAQECVLDGWWGAGPFVELRRPVEGTSESVERARSEKLPSL